MFCMQAVWENSLEEKSYKLNEINQAIDDFLKGKIIRPLIKI